MVVCRDFVDALAGIKGGNGTLLNNTLLFARGRLDRKSHAVEGIPKMVIGGAGRRVRTGYHKAGKADPASTGLSLQKATRRQVKHWGTKSMDTNKTQRSWSPDATTRKRRSSESCKETVAYWGERGLVDGTFCLL